MFSIASVSSKNHPLAEIFQQLIRSFYDFDTPNKIDLATKKALKNGPKNDS